MGPRLFVQMQNTGCARMVFFQKRGDTRQGLIGPRVLFARDVYQIYVYTKGFKAGRGYYGVGVRKVVSSILWL